MIEIFELEFMKRAFIAGLAIAIIAPMIGIFLVVRRYSLMADTLAHVSLAGVAIGVITKTHPVLAAMVTTITASLVIEYLRTKRKIFTESLLALFLSGSLAVAIVVLSIAKGLNADLLSFLFGSITTVSTNDIIFISLFSAFVVAIVLLLFKEFFFVALDEELAQANGVRANIFNIILIILTAVTVSLSMRTVGILLIGALMVIPVIAAMQFHRGFRQTLGLSIVFSVLAVISGLILSYYFDLASGATIVLIALVIFVLSIILNRKHAL